MAESRGNKKYGRDNDHQVGVEQVRSSLHFGPAWDQDAYRTSIFSKNNASGYHHDFHKYSLIWNKSAIKFFVDDEEMGNIPAGAGFWVC